MADNLPAKIVPGSSQVILLKAKQRRPAWLRCFVRNQRRLKKEGFAGTIIR